MTRFLEEAHQGEALAILKACYPDRADLHDEFRNRFATYLDPRHRAYATHFVGAFEQGTLVGIGGFSESSMAEEAWELSWGTVRPERQGRGVGKNLLDFRLAAILEKSRSAEVRCFIHTRPSRLYLEAGFTTLVAGAKSSFLHKKLR